MTTAVSVVAPGASKVLTSVSGAITYWTWRETTGAAGAVFRLWDSDRAGGQLVLSASLTSGESFRDFIDRGALPFRVGLFFELVSGAVEGAVYFGQADYEIEIVVP